MDCISQSCSVQTNRKMEVSEYIVQNQQSNWKLEDSLGTRKNRKHETYRSLNFQIIDKFGTYGWPIGSLAKNAAVGRCKSKADILTSIYCWTLKVDECGSRRQAIGNSFQFDSRQINCLRKQNQNNPKNRIKFGVTRTYYCKVCIFNQKSGIQRNS